MRWFLAIAAFVAPSATVLAAGAIPLSAEYRVTAPLPGDQAIPAAAVTSEGGFVVWRDNSLNNKGSRIAAVALGADLTAVGSPFPVSSVNKSKNAGEQDNPDVALLNGGGAVVVWDAGKASRQIFARFIKPDGRFAKADVRVTKTAKLDHANPSVCVLEDGSVVVVWNVDGKDGHMQGIYGQRFSAAGKKIGREFAVNLHTANNQRSPRVAAISDNAFVVTWVSDMQRNPIGGVDVIARVFNNAAQPLGSEIFVSTTTSNVCANPDIAGFGDGFIVAWSQRSDAIRSFGGTVLSAGAGSQRSSDGWDVWGRTFTAEGMPAGTPVRINTETFGDQFAPTVAILNSQAFVTWTSLGQDGFGRGVYGQLVSTGGALVGGEFRVNTTTAHQQRDPTVASDGESRFISIWSSFGAGTSFDLFAQTYLSQE